LTVLNLQCIINNPIKISGRSRRRGK